MSLTHSCLFLKAFPPFSFLDEENLISLASEALIRYCQEHDFIFRQDDHPGNFGSPVYLGEPIDNDGTNPIPGNGYDYCWTADATNGTWIQYANSNQLWLEDYRDAFIKMTNNGSSLFLYCNSAFVPGPDELVGDLRDCFNVRGELVINYALQVRPALLFVCLLDNTFFHDGRTLTSYHFLHLFAGSVGLAL